ncbi:MAG: SGNH/GDSL hydrolase family protein [Candidatus Thorarchaeota archaeon]|nr:SGNH/GDSL hydrolase family protein [Candidatus Thorarchaeota archaeon]
MFEFILAFFICLLMIALIYPLYMMQKAPRFGIAEALKASPVRALSKKRIVLLGDSITQGRIGDSYPEMLYAMLDQKYEFVNAGKNGDLTWNVLQRIEDVMGCHPDAVVILIGTNDALGSLPKGMAPPNWFVRIPRRPELGWFETNLRAIIQALKHETDAKIGILSLPPLGEDINHPAYHAAIAYSERIRTIAQHQNVHYLPLNEKMQSMLKEKAKAQEASFSEARMLIIKSVYKRYLLRRTWSDIAADSGFSLLIDHIHPSTEGANIIADLVSEFIQSV